jgi:hypothetical protein
MIITLNEAFAYSTDTIGNERSKGSSSDPGIPLSTVQRCDYKDLLASLEAKQGKL